MATQILVNIGSGNGLSPGQRQAINWTKARILLIGPLGTNFSEILIAIETFSFTKMHLEMSSGKCRPFCLGLNVLNAPGGVQLHRLPFLPTLLPLSLTSECRMVLMVRSGWSLGRCRHVLLGKACRNWWRSARVRSTWIWSMMVGNMRINFHRHWDKQKENMSLNPSCWQWFSETYQPIGTILVTSEKILMLDYSWISIPTRLLISYLK